ncbi:efflux RND transporter periplasmic adaptor subunit [Halomonas shantousis]
MTTSEATSPDTSSRPPAGDAPKASKRRPNRWMLALVSLVMLAVGIGLAMWLLENPPRMERRAPAPALPPLVETQRVTPGEAAPPIDGYGRVVADRETTLSSRVAGRLIGFAEDVDPGRIVEEGDVLATLENNDYQLDVRSARAALAQAEADLAIEQAEQLRARSEYKSFGQELSAERRALVLREPQLKAAQAAVESAQVALERAELDLARTQVTAPYRAMIQERLAGPGSELSANADIISLVDVEQFWVRVTLPTEALDWLSIASRDGQGSAVTLSSNAWASGESRQGELYSVLPSLEESGLMAQVMVRVRDPLALKSERPALRLGDVVHAAFEAVPREGLVSLPTRALRDDDQVWLLGADDTLQRRQVDVLYRGKNQVLIEDGLSAGERVITSSLATARQGMALRERGTNDPQGEATARASSASRTETEPAAPAMETSS